MESSERRSLEFKALQDEMLENSRKIYQIIASTIALCAGLIGYCFSPAHFPVVWGRPFALLSPFLILVPAMILIQSNQHSTVRIATFLLVVFDEKKDRELPGWQTAMHGCRECKTAPHRTQVDALSHVERRGRLRKLWTELKFVVKPETSGARHFHRGLRGILGGIAAVSTMGSAVAWWWLFHHDDFFNRHYFWLIATGYLISLGVAWTLFLEVHRDIREGWNDKRFEDWEKYWKGWAQEKDLGPIKREIQSGPGNCNVEGVALVQASAGFICD